MGEPADTEYSDQYRNYRFPSKRMGRIGLEVATLFYFLAHSHSIPVVQEYIYYLVAKKYNHTEHNKTVSNDIRCSVDRLVLIDFIFRWNWSL